jgi:hypothetical protein
MDEMHVDLTQAVTYAPALLCMLRLMIYLFITCTINEGAEIGGYSILGLLVGLDRVTFRIYLPNGIFDSNGIISAVFIANVYGLVRSYGTESRVPFVAIVLMFWWMGMCICMILEPVRLKRAFERKKRLYHIIPVMITCFSIGVLVFTHEPKEACLARFTKGMFFATLSIAWIYVVGIHQSQHMEPIKDTSNHFVSRFAPVLYTPLSVSVIFSVACGACIFWQYYTTFVLPLADVEMREEKERDAQGEARENGSVSGSNGEDLEAAEMFRVARMQSGKIQNA